MLTKSASGAILVLWVVLKWTPRSQQQDNTFIKSEAPTTLKAASWKLSQALFRA